MKLMEKKMDKTLIYPSIKLINAEREIRMDIVKNDILPRTAGQAIYFRIDYRFEKTVADCLAVKYKADIENYPEDDGEEHFIIGSTACDQSVSKLECPYMKKVWDILKKNKINRKKIISIYLLELDNSEGNGQKFIVLAADRIYLRWATKKMEEVKYTDVIFNNEGIKSRNLIDGLQGENDGYLIRYYFDDKFIEFAREIMLLHKASITGINETHPVSHLTYEKKSRYLAFLINIAASSGNLTARKLLKLEYLAREFGISAEEIVKTLKSALKGGIKDNRLGNTVSAIVSEVTPEEIRYVFYQEILEFTTSVSGESEREKLHQLLSKQTYAGEKFVKHYREFLKYRWAAETSLQNALLETAYPQINLPDIYRLQYYNNALMLQFLSIGVDINE